MLNSCRRDNLEKRERDSYARTHARMHARTHARTHTHTHARTRTHTLDRKEWWGCKSVINNTSNFPTVAIKKNIVPERFTIMKRRQQKVTSYWQKWHHTGIIVISNSRFHCLSSRDIQILIQSVKTPYRKLTNQSWKKKRKEQQMEADIKQQKVHGQETIQALLLVYNRPSLTRSQVSTFDCVLQFRIFFQLLFKCT